MRSRPTFSDRVSLRPLPVRVIESSRRKKTVAARIVDGTIVFSVRPDRAKVANIERDGRVVYHVSHEGSYLSFDAMAEVSPIPTETHGPAMDTLIGAFRAVAKKEHPDWDEFREAMVRERRRAITVTPTSVVGLINPVWG